MVEHWLLAFLAADTLLFLAVATTTLCWMLYAWWTPTATQRTGFPGDSPDGAPDQGRPRLTFSLIVPARHEHQVLAQTLATLAQLDHPCFEVIAVVGHDDPITRQVALATARRHPDLVRVVVDQHRAKTKPKALNSALPVCRGEVVGVFDAEDEVAPGLLRQVDLLFQRSGAGVVQGGVQLMNYRSSWWALRNVLEYYFWFRSRLHFQASQGVVTLGGNTVFVRRDLLVAVGGWDPECLAETVISGSGSAHAACGWRSPTTRGWRPGRRLPSAWRRCCGSGPAGTKGSCRCCAKATGGACRLAGSAAWRCTPWACPSCRRPPGR